MKPLVECLVLHGGRNEAPRDLNVTRTLPNSVRLRAIDIGSSVLSALSGAPRHRERS
jgi:hypothetical protein